MYGFVSCVVSMSVEKVMLSMSSMSSILEAGAGAEQSLRGQTLLSRSHCARKLKMTGWKPSRWIHAPLTWFAPLRYDGSN